MPDADGADGAATKKRRETKNLPAAPSTVKNAAAPSTAKKAAAPPKARTEDEFHVMFATHLLHGGMKKSNLTNSTKNSSSLALLMQKDALENLRKEHSYNNTNDH
jgi:hypothetical protein